MLRRNYFQSDLLLTYYPLQACVCDRRVHTSATPSRYMAAGFYLRWGGFHRWPCAFIPMFASPNSDLSGLTFTKTAPPIAGYMSDKIGPEWVLSFALLSAIPLWLLLIIRKELGMFIAFLVFASTHAPSLIAAFTF